MATLAEYIPESLPSFNKIFGSASYRMTRETDLLLEDFHNLKCVDLAADIRESSMMCINTSYHVPAHEYLGQTEDFISNDDLESNPQLNELLQLSYGNLVSVDMEDIEDDNQSVVLDLEDFSFLDDDNFTLEGSDGENSIRSSLSDDAPSPKSEDSSDNQPTLPAFASLCSRDNHINFDQFEDESNVENYEKPYCKSRRGAKNVLLWKFILQVLATRPDLAKWININEGTFKFVDTVVMSKMWGRKKRKSDMTFEKLSRGIRHYYKSGLMTRVENTRLVYKFNWQQVPKPYRHNRRT